MQLAVWSEPTPLWRGHPAVGMKSRLSGWIIYLALAILVCALSVSAQQLEIPVLTQRVTDLTNTLTSTQRSLIEDRLARFEDTTSTQIAVLIIPTLSGEELKDYSLRVAEKNKIGRQGRNNGVLFLIVIDDKKMRIEVGYGLEGALPDALCDQILRHEVRPRFLDNDYYGGVLAGVEAIMKATKGEYKADERKERDNVSWVPILVLVLVFFGFIFVSSLINRFIRGGRYIGSSRGWHSTGGWSGGWGGGGGWSSGGGGWSGGGGSFGGGGASGSW